MAHNDSVETGFHNPPLTAMLAMGAVTSGSARIWYRTPDRGSYRLRWRPRDADVFCGEQVIEIMDKARDFTGSVSVRAGLQPDKFYQIELVDGGGERIAEGSFRTSPVEGRRAQNFALGFLSCHQPFDEHGRIKPGAEEILTAMHRAFEQHDVRQVILGGDQMYSDFPKPLSLFDKNYFARIAPSGRDTILQCDAEEVRVLFHQRYRHFWNVNGWRQLLANYPCYPILDDHDIVDNWGSAAHHNEPEWQNFRRGAFQAYCDYQGALVSDPVEEPPEDMDYTTIQANSATYVMDLRSNRRVGENPRMLSNHQVQGLREFLYANSARDAIFIVLSVPIIHLPKAMSRLAARITPDGEDFSDRWSSRGHREDRGRILRLIHDHQGQFPDQRVVLLSGDIHIGCLHQIHWPDRTPNLYQLVSSGITHDAGAFIQVLSSAIIRSKQVLGVKDGPSAKVRLRKGVKRAMRNPCARVNFGIVEITRRDPDDYPDIEFFIYSHRDGQPVCCYRSGLIY